ncbi:hypothetical protein QYE76_020522 [Lolium multiflorum]|uniref:Uncharacterized protein n=1 Tax=Lolium multiflorum TaxID=4521 RepID=A0AAD8VRY7_LOLMU|nr:hypothetical protein QYE76_020522 [Lolium multiflorum]
MVLEEFFGHLLGKKGWGDGAMRDLELSLRAKGPVHPVYDLMLERCCMFADFGRLLGYAFSATGLGCLATSFLARHRAPYLPSQSVMQVLLAVPPRHVILMAGCACACLPVKTKMDYYDVQLGFAKSVLKSGDERTKTELAKIILNKHSDDKSLVEAVKRHFVADHVFSDQHQEKPPLLRWRERGTYLDGTLLEEMKEYEEELKENKAKLQKLKKELEALLKRMMKYEANNSDDEAESSVNVGLFQEDPLACILGTPGNNKEMGDRQTL